MGAETALMSLLKEENLIVKRNCMMSLAVICELAEVRTICRKTIGFHKTIINLIISEELAPTQEYALQCLVNLCKEYESINRILKANAFPLLVERLKSSDPDIIKNAIELIYELLLDFDAHSQLKQANGLPSILNLLDSEYPVIQTLSLQALSRATKNSIIRTNLRELDALDKFVSIIAKPEFNDLHLHTLHVISNLLEDLECIQQMKNNGGLRTLLDVITDSNLLSTAQPDATSIKPGSPTKERKSPVPAKKGSAKGKKKLPEEGTDSEKVPAFTLPEAKIFICQALTKLCRLDAIRKVLHSAELEKVMIILMGNDLEAVRCAAANVIAILAESTICQDTISKQGGLDCLIRMTKSDRKESKMAGVSGLATMTKANGSICRELLSRAYLADVLLSCLTMNDPGVESISLNALTVILNLSEEQIGRNKLVHGGIIRGLVNQLKMHSTQVNALACLAVAQIVCEEPAFNSFRQKEGIDLLVRLLKSLDVDVRRNASWALSIVASDSKCALQMLELGTLQTLKSAQTLVGGSSPQFDICIKRLYDQNLSAKLAYTGYLDFADVLPDTFYDVGGLRTEEYLSSLEDLSKAPINGKRPVYLYNVKIPLPLEVDEEAKSTANSSDKSNPKSPKKKGGKKSTENTSRLATTICQDEVGKENVAPVNEFLPATDLTLLQWFEQCLQMSETVKNTRDVATQLAMFVADKLGGQVSKIDLMNFRHDLDHASLKCRNNSNVIPMGSINKGVHIHRAILYKFLADRIGLCVNLVRGDYNVAYNQIYLLDFDLITERQTHFLYLIDLIHDPGKLYLADSLSAIEYAAL
ncbi:hypothetical protein Ciccas_002286 [Cichlidogyrus casuarinus]|uniref:EDR1/CTR1/ARMC3-like peptidase-like domain-containing protein n=1 Tax=Cichlidogyrus casuarinus TaxID=1844966 RepID=A0ABD2QHR1_9PLAT